MFAQILSDKNKQIQIIFPGSSNSLTITNIVLAKFKNLYVKIKNKKIRLAYFDQNNSYSCHIKLFKQDSPILIGQTYSTEIHIVGFFTYEIQQGKEHKLNEQVQKVIKPQLKKQVQKGKEHKLKKQVQKVIKPQLDQQVQLENKQDKDKDKAIKKFHSELIKNMLFFFFSG